MLHLGVNICFTREFDFFFISKMFKGALQCWELQGWICRAIDFEIFAEWLRENLIASLNSEVNSIVITYFNRSLKSIFYGDSSQDSICRAEHAVRWISPRLGVSVDNVWNKERRDLTRIWEDHSILLCVRRFTR